MKLFKMIFLLSACVFFFAGNAMALSYNSNRPYSDFGASGEDSLQVVFNTNIINGSIDAVTGQSNVALWTSAEAVVDQYLITLISGNTNILGIYSATSGAQYLLGVGTGDPSAAFGINNAGALYINGSLADANFGDSFGFYLQSANQVVGYTEDSKNNGGYGPDRNIMALTYLLRDGLKVRTQLMGGTDVTALGNNDWILAFEDTVSGGDHDFQDAVFYVEDMNPVPEPATMLLLGLGLVGLAGVARKRMA